MQLLGKDLRDAASLKYTSKQII